MKKIFLICLVLSFVACGGSKPVITGGSIEVKDDTVKVSADIQTGDKTTTVTIEEEI